MKLKYLINICKNIPFRKDFSEKEIDDLIKTSMPAAWHSLYGVAPVRFALIRKGMLWTGSVPRIYRKHSDVPVKPVSKPASVLPRRSGRSYRAGGSACGMCPIMCSGTGGWCPLLD